MNADASAPRRTRHYAGLADGAKLTSIDMAALHAGLLASFAVGLRTGIPVELLDGYTAYTDLHAMVITNSRRNEIDQHRSDLIEARRLAANARTLAAREQDIDSAAAREYIKDARNHARRATEIEETITRLENFVRDRSMPDTFDGEVGYLLDGLAALMTSDDHRAERTAVAAFQQVVDDLRLTLDGDRVTWRTYLLVPADGLVYRAGPFTGSVPARGKVLTPAELIQATDSAGAGVRRRADMHALTNVGYPQRLARTITQAPGRHLTRVLLGDDVIWPDCPPNFDHEKFNGYLRSVYAPHPAWTESVYCHTNVARQALVDIVAAVGGHATIPQIEPLLQVKEINRDALYYMTLPRPDYGTGVPRWPATVARIGTWTPTPKSPPSEMVSRRCPTCSQPATAVVRVPEIPDSLLCRTCHIMPSRPDLQFPPIYIDLALPPTTLDPKLINQARTWTSQQSR